MSFPVRSIVAGLGALALLSVACSGSSGPSEDLTFGTFLVTIPQFDLQSPGPCDVLPFELIVSRDSSGQTGVVIPQASYSCAGFQSAVDLSVTDFGNVADSLELIWTDSSVAPLPRLVLRWKPGTTNVAGSAVFLSVIGVDTVSWSGARQ